MKKFFLFATAAVALTVGCQKQELGNVDPMDDGAQVPVSFATSVSASAASATVKSAGALNDVSDLAGKKLYVYGFVQGAALNQSEHQLGDGTKVSPFLLGNANGGLEVTATAPTGNPYETKEYYGTVNYDFYGYYVDDAKEGNVAVAANTVSIPVKINGQQDLLIAKTNKVKDVAASGNSTVDMNKVYSAHSARRGVVPTLVFDHQLTQFTFNLINGSELGEVDGTDVKLRVDTLAVKSNNTGNLVIDVTDEDNCKLVETPGVATENYASLFYSVEAGQYVAEFEAKGDKKTLDGSIMVMPGQTSYNMVLDLTQTGHVDEQGKLKKTTTTLPIKLSDGAAFKAGYSYEVTVMVYAQEAVLVNVALSDWKVGEAVTIDPDATAPVVKPADQLHATFAELTNDNKMVYNVNVPEGYYNVQAALSEDANSVPANAEWVALLPTRAATTQYAVFSNFLAETVYYCHLRYTETDVDLDDSEVTPEWKGVTSTESVVSSSFAIVGEPWLVENNQESYEELPEAYWNREGYRWAECKDVVDLPWIAVTFTPCKEVEASVRLNNKLIKSFEGEGVIGLLTVSAAELGKEELPAGNYVFTINGEKATFTLPVPQEPEE